MMKILIADDDVDLLGMIGFTLNQAGYLIVEAADGVAALNTFTREQPNLVILEVNIAGLSGFEVCARIRAQANTPIMLLTVRNSEEDQIRGLDLGADDYLTKPFSPRTLLARVRALLRRGAIASPRPLIAGGLVLDAEQRAVSIGGDPSIRLTHQEFRLLQFLVARPGRVIPMENLITHVWGYQGSGDRQLLKQLIYRVRQKIEDDPTRPRYIVTMPGIGYVLQPGPPGSEQDTAP